MMTDHKEKIRMLPAHMRESVLDYIETGAPVGGFLTALLSNDLRGTFERADEQNRAAVFVYLSFLYNHAPSQCWGSPQRLRDWQERGGLKGKTDNA